MILASELHAVERWPKVGESKVFILNAIQLIGQQMFGGEWQGDELFVRMWPLSPLSEYQNPLARGLHVAESMAFNERMVKLNVKTTQGHKYPASQEEHDVMKANLIKLSQSKLDAASPESVMQAELGWHANRLAFERLSRVVTWIGDACRNGTIRTYYKATDWQQVYALPPHRWNCSQDLEYWFPNAGAESTVLNGIFGITKAAHFFLDRSDLELATRILSHKPVEIPIARLDSLSPDLRLAVEIALELELFQVNADGNKWIKRRIGEAAKRAGREISPRKVDDMASVMRWPDGSKASRGKKS